MYNHVITWLDVDALREDVVDSKQIAILMHKILRQG